MLQLFSAFTGEIVENGSLVAEKVLQNYIATKLLLAVAIFYSS